MIWLRAISWASWGFGFGIACRLIKFVRDHPERLTPVIMLSASGTRDGSEGFGAATDFGLTRGEGALNHPLAPRLTSTADDRVSTSGEGDRPWPRT